MTIEQQLMIDKVWNSPHMLKHPSKNHPTLKDKEGKNIKVFAIDKEEFYCEGENVYANFSCTNGERRRYKFYFQQFNIDEKLKRMGKELIGNFESLMVEIEVVG